MTIIKTNGYRFAVDVEQTMQYYRTHSLCDCADCRNFYAQVKERFPVLDTFIQEFGVDLAKPDEVMSIDEKGEVEYLSADYTVCGTVLTMANAEIRMPGADSIFIAVIDGFASPNEQTGDYFTLSVNGIRLPWRLDEP